MSSRYMKRSYDDPRKIFPTTLTFPNVQLDAQGRYTLDLKDFEMVLTNQTQISLSECYVDMEYMHNIVEETRFVEIVDFPSKASSGKSTPKPVKDNDKPGRPDFFRFSQKSIKVKSEKRSDNALKTKLYYPSIRVATVKHLMDLLDFLLYDQKVRFSASGVKNELIFMADSECQSISLDAKTARCLGFLRADNSIPTLLQNQNKGNITFTLTDQNSRLKFERMKAKQELKIEIPIREDTVIWNFISESSFQDMIVSVDIMKQEFTGTTLTKTLSTMTIHPEQTKMVYNPWSAHWVNVESGTKNRVSLQFHDTTGKPFSNLSLTFVLKFRKTIVA